GLSKLKISPSTASRCHMLVGVRAGPRYCVRTARVWWRDSLEPYLSPKRKYCSWTEQPAFAVPSLTEDGRQYDCRGLHVEHPSGLLVDQFADSPKNPVRSAAKRNHFLIESHPPILGIAVASREYLLVAFYSHPVTWLEVEFADRRQLSNRIGPFADWPR